MRHHSSHDCLGLGCGGNVEHVKSPHVSATTFVGCGVGHMTGKPDLTGVDDKTGVDASLGSDEHETGPRNRPGGFVNCAGTVFGVGVGVATGGVGVGGGA